MLIDVNGNYKYSSDIQDSDFLRIEIFSVAVGCQPFDAISVWMSESGLYTTAFNPNGGASGLFQAMPFILKGLGYRPELNDDDTTRAAAFRKESFAEQLRWARKYYLPHKRKLLNRAAFYTATFLPADIDLTVNGTADTVLVQKDGRRGWAYIPNSGFDTNKDYIITVGELESAIDRACRGPRWEEISERMAKRLDITPLAAVQPTPYDLGTVLGIQQALNKLGFKAGPEDGIAGALTIAAIKTYQHVRGLTSDGICGPITRQSLQSDLDKLSLTT